jgi:hypothetical protein
MHIFRRKEVGNTNFIVFGLTQPGLEPTIYRIQSKQLNHCTTNVVNTMCNKVVWHDKRASTIRIQLRVCLWENHAKQSGSKVGQSFSKFAVRLTTRQHLQMLILFFSNFSKQLNHCTTNVVNTMCNKVVWHDKIINGSKNLYIFIFLFIGVGKCIIIQLEILHKQNSVEQWLVFLANSVKYHVFDLPLGQAKGHNKGIYCLSNRLTEELAQQWEYNIWVDYCFNELALCGHEYKPLIGSL